MATTLKSAEKPLEKGVNKTNTDNVVPGRDETVKGNVGKNPPDEDILKSVPDTQTAVSPRPDGDGSDRVGVVDVNRILDMEERESIPDINFYQHKKTLAKGMMDLALFSANANQLRYVLECQDRHPFFYPSLIFILFSLICQVVVGAGLLWNSTFNVKHEMQQANRANNYTVIAIFLVTVVNVFISAFGVANPPPIR